MTPILFGPHQRRLFGMYHPAEGERAAGLAVLLCAPFGHEAIRTHRFYRLLAVRLARQGVAVLRFDGYGTGDSPGEDEEGELDGWRGDIAEAHGELVSRAGATQVVWFGARLGASLALQAAPGVTPRVDKLVVWEPVLEGPPYLQELREKHVEELELSHSIPDPDWRRSLRRDPDAFASEVLGFAISPLLRSQIQALSPSAFPLAMGTALALIAKPEHESARKWVLGQQAAGRDARWVSLRHSLIWTSNPHPDNEMVPAEALQRVIAEIHERNR